MLTEVTVGVVGRAHGVAGEVYVDARTDEPERRFLSGQLLYLRSGRTRSEQTHAPGELTVHQARRHQDRWLVTFTEVADRETAESLRGMSLACQVPTNEQPSGENEYYDRQLIGLTAQTADAGGGARPVGTVRSVLHEGGQDVLEILVGDQIRLVPFVTALVPEVDLIAGAVTIADIPGLLAEADAGPDSAQH